MKPRNVLGFLQDESIFPDKFLVETNPKYSWQYFMPMCEPTVIQFLFFK